MSNYLIISYLQTFTLNNYPFKTEQMMVNNLESMNEAKPEIKHCKRCQNPFECKLGNIAECQCFDIQLNNEEKNYIEQLGVEDCLCSHCLRGLQKEYHFLFCA